MNRTARGFSLIELTATLVLVAALAAVALPRLLDLRDEARVASLRGIAGTMNSTIALVRAKASASGLSAAASNPGGANQTSYVIDTPFGRSEVDWRNLCPESRAEVGDALTMLDFTTIRSGVGGLQTRVNNRSTRVGYDLSNGNGCYVEYDSFACTVTVVEAGCD